MGIFNKNFQQVIKSPDGRVGCRFSLERGRAFYKVWKDDKEVVSDSRLGLELAGEGVLGENLQLVRTHTKTFAETWQRPWGASSEVENHYHEAAFYLTDSQQRLLVVRVRVFDEGVAVRMELPAQPQFRRAVIMNELTEFNLHPNAWVWQIPAYQPDRYEYLYSRQEAQLIRGAIHTPATAELPNGLWVAVHEAALYDYGAMNLTWGGNANAYSENANTQNENGSAKFESANGFRADITPRSDGCRAKVDLPFNTPWRVLMIGDSPLDLTVNNMILNLNEPPRGDFSWVKPLKFMGIWWAMYVGEWTWAPGERHGATTEHTEEYIDFCQKYGITGLLTEGWNDGWEGDWLQNGATTDFTHAEKDFDLPKVAKYAKEHNVELVGHHETVGFVDNYEKQLANAYAYYAENGVHYIKTGYANSRMMVNGRQEWHHSQIGVNHYQKTVELAARYQIMLDIHEPIKGTGLERTWPNLLTREGARGQEYAGGDLPPEHTCILPFTRLLAGGMDYTPGIFDVTNSARRVDSTIARQLAYFVVIESAMQMAADRPKLYEQYPQLFKFIREVPVSWRRTVPLAGQVGEFYAVARQSRETDDWFIGAITNSEAREVVLPLDFLDDGAEYAAEIYCDDPGEQGAAADYETNPLAWIRRRKMVRRGEELRVWLARGGGCGVKISKI